MATKKAACIWIVFNPAVFKREYQPCGLPSLVALEELDNKIYINQSHISNYIKYLNILIFQI